MPRPLIATKLFVPRLRPGLVARPRLLERLRAGARSRLTLVSAPAGFGKTTLLAEWLQAETAADRSVAWLSLDAADSDPASFWTGVVTALDTTGARPPFAGTGARRGHSDAGRTPAHHPAERARRNDGRVVAGPRRLPPRRQPRRRRRAGLLLGPPPPSRPRRHHARGQTPTCRSPGGGYAASWPRSAPPTCGSHPTRRARTSTTCRDLTSPPSRSRPWSTARRDGSRRSSSRRSPFADERTSVGSSRGSPGTTVTSSTTWWTRCSVTSDRAGSTIPAADRGSRPAHRAAVRRGDRR